MKKRILKNIIDKTLKNYNCIYLNGARQVGKSTLVQQIANENNFDYISFDDIKYRSLAMTSPKNFIDKIENSIVLDEVQMVPEIFLPLKEKIDYIKKEGINQKILLTGSASIMALPHLSDALVGRMIIFTLNPFCGSEFLEKENNFIEKVFKDNFYLQKFKQDVDLKYMITSATFPEI